MANLLATLDIWSVRVWCRFLDQASVNTYNFFVSAVSGATVTDQDLANTFSLFFSAFYPNVLTNLAEYRGVQCYRVKPTTPAFNPTHDVSNAAMGAGGAFSLPRNTCAIAKYAGTLRGPRYRGRVFLPFGSGNQMGGDGELAPATVTYIDAFLATLLLPTVITVGAGSATLNWCILHRKPVIDFTFIESAEAANKFGQMHKRGDYGRPNSSPI